MSKDTSSKNSGPFTSGAFWFAGWLFTLGFVKLIWWKALLALVIWPYYLGSIISVVPGS